MRRIAPLSIAELQVSREPVKVAGMITAIRSIKTKSGDSMALVQLDDRSARLEVTLFNDLYSRVRSLLVPDQLLVAEGEIQEDKFNGGLRMRASGVLSLAEARKAYVREIRLHLSAPDWRSGRARALQECLHELLQPETGAGSVEGACPLVVVYDNEEASVTLQFGEQWALPPLDAHLQKLRAMLGESRVTLGYH